MAEQRRYRRFECSFRVLLRGADSSPEGIEARMVDVSYSGIGVAVQDPVPIAEKVMIEVLATGGASEWLLLGEGEAVYARSGRASDLPQQVGIRFTAPDETVIQKLLQIIQTRHLVEARRHKRASKQRAAGGSRRM